MDSWPSCRRNECIIMIRCIVLNVTQVPWVSSPPTSLYSLEIILKMVKITPLIMYFLGVHDKMYCQTCHTSALGVDLHVRTSAQGSFPPPLLYNLEIILKMVEIPTHKPYIFLMVIIRRIHMSDKCNLHSGDH